ATALTEEQIAYLNSKYDFQNITLYSPNVQDFFNDLVKMNLISSETANSLLTPMFMHGEVTYTDRDGVERNLVSNPYLADGTLSGSLSVMMKHDSGNTAYSKVINILMQL
ncbi:MAG: hypothetical protein FWE74_01520, partial [Oscillospiraceae bacterium]|nr:hypothetical protein [Oscillospiraceae bacterium]